MKILLVIFLGFVVTNSLAQDVITIQGKKSYFHGTKWISKSEIKLLIESQGDPIAIRYYSNYETGKIVGISSIVLGAALNIAGYSAAEKDFWGYPVETHPLQIVGTVLYGVGTIALIAKKKSLRNAINRFNSLQQQTKLEFGATRNGLGLTYNF